MIYPSGRYNLNFDLCAGFLNLFLLFTFFRKKNVRNLRSHLVALMTLTLMLSAFAEFATGAFRNVGSSSLPVLEAVTCFAHFFHISVEYLMALYVLELTGRAYSFTWKKYLFFSVPEIALAVATVLPCIRRLLYSYDVSGQYTRESFYSFYAFVASCYVLYSMLLLLRYRKSMGKDFWYILTCFYAFLGGLILELINPYLRASIFMQSLFMTGCLLILENNDEMMDAETGLFSAYALKRDAEVLFGNRTSSYAIAVKLQHYQHYSMMLGMDTTNRILREIGRWLMRFEGARTHIYRTGTGEFALLLGGCTEEAASSVAQQILNKFSGVWEFHTMRMPISVQVWMTKVPEQMKTQEQLGIFVGAEYNDRLPKDRIYLADELREEERRISVEMAVRRALENRSLEVYYQPIYDTKCGKIHSAEALVRLKDEELGMISPEEFIPVAEQTGMIAQIGDFVFTEVCRFLSSGAPQHAGLQFVEVNLSAVQCMDTQLPERLLSIAEGYGVSPSEINLEITESAMVYSMNTMRSVMEELTKDGFSFALDDFGTGRANLSYLQNFPFRIIKVDKSFLWAEGESEDNHVIFENMLSLIRGLRREAVAEGVETKEQRDMLISHGVEYLQGFYYSKPVPEQEFMKYLEEFCLSEG